MEYDEKRHAYGLKPSEIEKSQCRKVATLNVYEVPGTAYAQKEGLDGYMIVLEDEANILRKERESLYSLLQTVLKWATMGQESSIGKASAAIGSYHYIQKERPELLSQPEDGEKYEQICREYDEMIEKMLSDTMTFLEMEGGEDNE